MCDIYMAVCKCGRRKVDMHLADYNTGRDEIVLYCNKCIPKKIKKAILWEYRDSPRFKPLKIWVKALTENAWVNYQGNHPNSSETEILKEVL